MNCCPPPWGTCDTFEVLLLRSQKQNKAGWKTLGFGFVALTCTQVELAQVVNYRLELPFASLKMLENACCIVQIWLLYSPGNVVCPSKGVDSAEEQGNQMEPSSANGKSCVTGSIEMSSNAVNDAERTRTFQMPPDGAFSVVSGRWILIRNMTKGACRTGGVFC